MKNLIVRSLTAVTLFAVAIASSGCAGSGGTCPQVTQTLAEGLAYGGSLAAIKKGEPVSVLTSIASNIDADVASGQILSNALDIAISKAGGQTWAESLGAIDILFGTMWESSASSNLVANPCTLPVMEDASAGIKLAVLLSGQPAKMKLVPFQK